MLICFFSSRRRHTMYIGDWSSDVCSSDLIVRSLGLPVVDADVLAREVVEPGSFGLKAIVENFRSEERRVGKECRCGWSAEYSKDDLRLSPLCRGLASISTIHILTSSATIG